MSPWICPRCGTVWAGWVAKCKCKPPTSVSVPTVKIGDNWYDDDGVVTDTVRCTCSKKGDTSADIPCPVHDMPVSWTVPRVTPR